MRFNRLQLAEFGPPARTAEAAKEAAQGLCPAMKERKMFLL